MAWVTEPTSEGWSIRSPSKTGRDKQANRYENNDTKAAESWKISHMTPPNSLITEFQNTEMGNVLGEDFKSLLIKTGQ